MSYRNYSNWCWVINWSDLCKLFPKETGVLEVILDTIEMSMDGFGYSVESDYWDDVTEDEHQRVLDELNNLQDRFAQEYPGLFLGVGYIHEDDDADDGPGIIWYVNGILDYSPSGALIKDVVRQISWVSYG